MQSSFNLWKYLKSKQLRGLDSDRISCKKRYTGKNLKKMHSNSTNIVNNTYFQAKSDICYFWFSIK